MKMVPDVTYVIDEATSVYCKHQFHIVCLQMKQVSRQPSVQACGCPCHKGAREEDFSRRRRRKFGR